MKLVTALVLTATLATITTSGQTPPRPPQQDKRGLGIQPTTTEAKLDKNITGAREKPELVLQSGHTAQVISIAFAPNGKWLATGSSDSTIKIWDAETYVELRTLAGHTAGITSITISNEGRWLVSWSGDNTARLWDVITGREVHSYPSKRRPTISADFGVIAAVQVDGSVKIWKLISGEQFPFNPAPKLNAYSVALSPDANRLAVGFMDRSIAIVDPVTGTQLTPLTGVDSWASSLAFSRDGKFLAAGYAVTMYRNGSFGEKIPLGFMDGAVALWSMESGKTVWVQKAHKDEVASVSFSANGQWLVSQDTGRDKIVHIWQTTDGVGVSGKLLNAYEPREISVAFSPDGKYVARSGNVQLTETTSGSKLWLVKDWSETKALTFSPDGKQLAEAYGNREVGGVKLYNTLTGDLIRNLSAATKPVNLFGFPQAGSYLAMGQQDEPLLGGNTSTQRLHFWDTATGVPVQSITWPIQDREMQGVWFQSDGSRFVIANNNLVQVFDVSTGQIVKSFSGDSKNIVMMDLSDDGHKLATYGIDGLRVWDPSTGTPIHSIAKDGVMQDVVVSADGTKLARISLGGRPAIQIFDLATGQEIKNIPMPDGLWRLAFSPDGSRIAGGTLGKREQNVFVWEVESQKLLHSLSLVEGFMVVRHLRFSPDGKQLAVADSKHVVRIWEFPEGRLRHTVPAHTTHISSLEFNNEATMLATSSYDGTTAIWDTRSGAELARLLSLRKGTDWIVTTPDGLFDGSPNAWKDVLWRFGGKTFDVAPVEAFFNEFYYPGLLGQILSGNRPKAPRSIGQLDRRQPSLSLTLQDTAGTQTAIATREVGLTIDVMEAPSDATHSSGSGARDVRLFRNGSLVRAWRGELKLDSQGKTRMTAKVPIVAGENRFSVYAFNRDNIKSLDSALTVTGSEQLRRKGLAYVIAVGINSYSNADYNLKYAVADAQEFSAQLAQQQMRLGNYERVVTVPLLDGDATKANIREALRRLASSQPAPAGTFPTALNAIKPAEPEDAVLVFFASHGLAQGDRFYLIPTDMGYAGSRSKLSEAGLHNILAHSISDIEFEQAFEKIDARQLLLVIDACNSGQALEAEEKRRGPMNSKGLAQLAYEKGMYVLTAAQGYQAALEAAQLGHGYLTYALVEEGLKTRSADTSPADGQVFIREWLDFATRRVPQMQQNKIQEQQKQGRQLELVIKFAESDSGKDRSLQRPRVFYRREVEISPLIVAKP